MRIGVESWTLHICTSIFKRLQVLLTSQEAFKQSLWSELLTFINSLTKAIEHSELVGRRLAGDVGTFKVQLWSRDSWMISWFVAERPLMRCVISLSVSIVCFACHVQRHTGSINRIRYISWCGVSCLVLTLYSTWCRWSELVGETVGRNIGRLQIT